MTTLEGRLVRRREAAPAPPGVRSDLDVLAGLGRRLAAVNPGIPSDAVVADPVATYDELRRGQPGRSRGLCPVAPGGAPHPGTPRLLLDRVGTPDGRARLVAVSHRPVDDDLRADAPVLWSPAGSSPVQRRGHDVGDEHAAPRRGPPRVCTPRPCSRPKASEHQRREAGKQLDLRQVEGVDVPPAGQGAGEAALDLVPGQPTPRRRVELAQSRLLDQRCAGLPAPHDLRRTPRPGRVAGHDRIEPGARGRSTRQLGLRRALVGQVRVGLGGPVACSL